MTQNVEPPNCCCCNDGSRPRRLRCHIKASAIALPPAPVIPCGFARAICSTSPSTMMRPPPPSALRLGAVPRAAHGAMRLSIQTVLATVLRACLRASPDLGCLPHGIALTSVSLSAVAEIPAGTISAVHQRRRAARLSAIGVHRPYVLVSRTGIFTIATWPSFIFQYEAVFLEPRETSGPARTKLVAQLPQHPRP